MRSSDSIVTDQLQTTKTLYSALPRRGVPVGAAPWPSAGGAVGTRHARASRAAIVAGSVTLTGQLDRDSSPYQME